MMISKKFNRVFIPDNRFPYREMAIPIRYQSIMVDFTEMIKDIDSFTIETEPLIDIETDEPIKLSESEVRKLEELRQTFIKDASFQYDVEKHFSTEQMLTEKAIPYSLREINQMNDEELKQFFIVQKDEETNKINITVYIKLKDMLDDRTAIFSRVVAIKPLEIEEEKFISDIKEHLLTKLKEETSAIYLHKSESRHKDFVAYLQMFGMASFVKNHHLNNDESSAYYKFSPETIETEMAEYEAAKYIHYITGRFAISESDFLYSDLINGLITFEKYAQRIKETEEKRKRKQEAVDQLLNAAVDDMVSHLGNLTEIKEELRKKGVREMLCEQGYWHEDFDECWEDFTEFEINFEWDKEWLPWLLYKEEIIEVLESHKPR